MGRAPCCDKVGLKKGRWTEEEDQKLTNYISQNGEGSWRSLPKNAGLLRCGKSCRLRWINYLRSDLKRGNITPQEEETIIKLHATMGNRWSLIAGQLPGRTDNEIKNYWNSHLSRKIHTFIRPNADPNGGSKIIVNMSRVTTPPKRRGGRTSRAMMQRNRTAATTATATTATTTAATTATAATVAAATATTATAVTATTATATATATANNNSSVSALSKSKSTISSSTSNNHHNNNNVHAMSNKNNMDRPSSNIEVVANPGAKKVGQNSDEEIESQNLMFGTPPEQELLGIEDLMGLDGLLAVENQETNNNPLGDCDGPNGEGPAVDGPDQSSSTGSNGGSSATSSSNFDHDQRLDGGMDWEWDLEIGTVDDVGHDFQLWGETQQILSRLWGNDDDNLADPDLSNFADVVDSEKEQAMVAWLLS